MRRLWPWMVWCGVALGCGGALSGAEWGDLTGRFILDGTPPVPEKLKITSDQEVCCKHDLKSEALVVNPDNKGIRDIMVYLFQNKSGVQSAYDKKEVPIHESYLPSAEEPIKVDNNACRFDPHVALVWTRQTVILGNSDPIGHNVKIECGRDNEPSNDTIPSGGTIERTFKLPERLPVRVSCSIHPWMSGWFVIRDTPYMAVTDADGKFELKNLPAGEWQFMFYQEKAGYVRNVKIHGKPEEWKKGLRMLTIKPGQQDLGEIVVGLDLFK